MEGTQGRRLQGSKTKVGGYIRQSREVPTYVPKWDSGSIAGLSATFENSFWIWSIDLFFWLGS